MELLARGDVRSNEYVPREATTSSGVLLSCPSKAKVLPPADQHPEPTAEPTNEGSGQQTKKADTERGVADKHHSKRRRQRLAYVRPCRATGITTDPPVRSIHKP